VMLYFRARQSIQMEDPVSHKILLALALPILLGNPAIASAQTQAEGGGSHSAGFAYVPGGYLDYGYYRYGYFPGNVYSPRYYAHAPAYYCHSLGSAFGLAVGEKLPFVIFNSANAA
jgi:hypothetical protein